MKNQETINFNFNHGLGDCSLFAHALPSWIKRGYEVELGANNYSVLFQVAGCKIIPKGRSHHPYSHSWETFDKRPWINSKLGWNLVQPPLPEIAPRETLWEEACSCRLSLAGCLDEGERKKLDEMFDPIKPFICLHARGNTCPAQKNLPPHIHYDLYRQFTETTPYNVLVMEEKLKEAPFKHKQVRYLYNYRKLSLPELAYVLDKASCLIGVDSGPLHFARFTSVPAVGLWYYHPPSVFALPRPETIHLSPCRFSDDWNTKEGFGIIGCDTYRADCIIENALDWIKKNNR